MLSWRWRWGRRLCRSGEWEKMEWVSGWAGGEHCITKAPPARVIVLCVLQSTRHKRAKWSELTNGNRPKGNCASCGWKQKRTRICSTLDFISILPSCCYVLEWRVNLWTFFFFWHKERLKWTDDDRTTMNSSFSTLVDYSHSIDFQRLLSSSVNPLWNCRMTDDGPNTLSPWSQQTNKSLIIHHAALA